MIGVPFRTLRDHFSFLFFFLFQHSTVPIMPYDRGKVQMSGFLSRCSFAKEKTLYFQGLVQNPLAYRWPSVVVSIRCLIPNALAGTQAFYNTVIHIVSTRCSRGSGLEAVTILSVQQSPRS